MAHSRICGAFTNGGDGTDIARLGFAV